MTIFSRLTDIVNANINSLLEHAENPGKMVRLMIQEMEDTLVEVRSEAVKAIADQKELERKIGKLEAGQRDWESKAEFALDKGRDDLAKGALVAKRKLSEQAATVRAELRLVDESLGRQNADLAKLQAKLAEAKARKKALEIRMKSAKGRVRVHKTLNDARVTDALDRYDSLGRRIDELEAEVDVYDLGKTKSLDQEFADLEVETDIANELARLKARRNEKSVESDS